MFEDKMPAFFEQRLQMYCKTKDYDWNKLQLSRNEMLQMTWYEISALNQTPQAIDVSRELNFDIRRSIGRLYCLVLFAQGDESAYKEFISKQKPPVLTWNTFQNLAAEFQKFSPQEQQALRITCVLTLKTGVTDVRFRDLGKPFDSNIDSEKFLTMLVNEFDLDTIQQVHPLLRDCDQTHIDILRSAYWADSHFRHLLFTEGSDRMMKSLVDGKDQYQSQHWIWRWLLNLAAFNVDVGSNLNQTWYGAFELVRNSVQQVVADPKISYLENYLGTWANQFSAALEGFSVEQQRWIMHIALFSTRELLTEPQVHEVAAAMKILLEQEPLQVAQTLKDYHDFCRSDAAITPAYTPAIFSNLWALLQQPGYEADLAKENLTPLMGALLISSRVLGGIYEKAKGQYITCLDFSKADVLKGLIPNYLQRSCSQLPPLLLDVNEKGQIVLIAQRRPELEMSF